MRDFGTVSQMRAFFKHFVLIAFLLNLCTFAVWGQSSRRDRSSRNQRSESADDQTQRMAAAKGFLSRLDANHNGIIEAGEVPETHRAIVEGLLHRVGIEPKYPLDLSKFAPSSSAANGGEHTGGAKPEHGEPAASGSGHATPSKPAASDLSKSGKEEPKPASAVKTDSKPAASASPETPKHEEKAAAAAPAADDSAESPVKRVIRQRSAKERLPEGLPDWFREKDRDGDGQVMMFEFAREWTAEKAAEFDRLDLNHDGIITPSECLKAQRRSAARG